MQIMLTEQLQSITHHTSDARPASTAWVKHVSSEASKQARDRAAQLQQAQLKSGGPELMKLGRSRRKELRAMSSLERGPPLGCRDLTLASCPSCVRCEISWTTRLSSGLKCLHPTHHRQM